MTASRTDAVRKLLSFEHVQARGWTEAMIRKHLGPWYPHYPLVGVIRAEETEAWQKDRNRLMRVRATLAQKREERLARIRPEHERRRDRERQAAKQEANKLREPIYAERMALIFSASGRWHIALPDPDSKRLVYLWDVQTKELRRAEPLPKWPYHPATVNPGWGTTCAGRYSRVPAAVGFG